MRLWGKVVRVMLLVMAAVFAVVAIVAPQARSESLVVAVLSIVGAFFGVPAVVRFFMSFTGDEEVLANGVAGAATITSLKPTGWRYNRYYPIVRFGLSVEAGGAAYPVEVKQAVDPELLDRLVPGVVVTVRVDRENHKKVVIDWREPIRATHDAAGGDWAEQQATATQSSSHQPAKGSLLPFLRWGFLIFGLIFFRLSCEEGDYEKGGARGQGIVLQKTYSPGTHSTGGRGGSSSKHYVSYRFTTKEGRTIEGRYDVLPGTWQKLKKGDPVTIEYLPDSPDTNRIPEQRARSLTWTLIALVLLVASGVLFIITRRQRLAQAKQ
ncbi:MAG: DUF3592 domain-containing protein [Candidatus Binatia bacterium]